MLPMLRMLFTPLKLNQLQLPNRVLMSSMHLNLDDEPDQYERMAQFYALRAKEQIALIVTAGCGPDAAGKASQNAFSLECDELIAKHRIITQAVHEQGGRIALQILHFGREAFHGGLVSSSAQRLPSNIFTPKPLSESALQDTIAAFADCAQRGVQAGYDAIELVFSQGFLVHQFLAPSCNTRDDRWGGSFDNRARLAVDIAQAVRARVGPHYPLIFRVPCMDLLDGGLTSDESLALIDKLMPYGIDLLNVSIGWHESDTPTIAMVVPRAAFVSASQRVRQRFPNLLTAISNRINDPRTGEAILLAGDADVVAMARPFLADPALVTKARANQFDAINTCIACNQSCLDYVFTGRAVGCSVNPGCGLPSENRWPALKKSLTVGIVGGGIAGMGVALFLALRGARVVLFEASHQLGGQLRMAASIPDKSEFNETVRYYSHAIRSAGVDVRLGERFDADTLNRQHWDHIVLAQGSQPRRLADLPGVNLPHVRDYTEVLAGRCPVALPVVIVGGGGVACDVAKYLSQQTQTAGVAWHRFLKDWGPKSSAAPDVLESTTMPNADQAPITLLQRSSRKFAHRVGRTTRWILMEELHRAGVAMRSRIDIQEITPTGVLIYDRGRDVTELVPAHSVIMAVGQEPSPAPLAALQALAVPYSMVGAARGDSGGANLTSTLSGAYQLAMEFT